MGKRRQPAMKPSCKPIILTWDILKKGSVFGPGGHMVIAKGCWRSVPRALQGNFRKTPISVSDMT